jgi:hypothetical protein
MIGEKEFFNTIAAQSGRSRNVDYGMSAIVRSPSAQVVRHWRRTQQIWTKSCPAAIADATLGENTIGEVLHVSA